MKTTFNQLILFFFLSLATVSTTFAHTDNVSGTKVAVTMNIPSGKMLSAGDALMAHIESAEATVAQVVVTDAQGRLVWSKTLPLAEGRNLVKFRLSELHSGTYFLNIAAAGNTETSSFFVR